MNYDGIESELERLLEESIRQAQERNRQDPELNTKEWIHLHSILEAFAQAVLRADPWYRGYRVPTFFSEVLDYIAGCLENHYGKDLVVQESINDLSKLVEGWARDSVVFRSWNLPKDGNLDKVKFTSRYDYVEQERDFISLSAVFQCFRVVLRDQNRMNKDFDNRVNAWMKAQKQDE